MRRLAATVCALTAMVAGGCTAVVRYGDALVDPRGERTWAVRVPATIGGTAGFAVGLPIDVVAAAPAWVYYRSLPRETRDPLSVFLFPSFVLWKAGVLAGAPFDAVEWALWRSWRGSPGMSVEQREAVEREWDARGAFPVYPVTPILPAPNGAAATS